MKIEFWWDDQDRNATGWYARELDDQGQHLDDSVKVWFRVDVNDFSEDEDDALADALAEAYPDHEIVAR